MLDLHSSWSVSPWNRNESSEAAFLVERNGEAFGLVAHTSGGWLLMEHQGGSHNFSKPAQLVRYLNAQA